MTHQSSPGECASVGKEKEPEGASKVARDGESIKRARDEARARNMRIEDLDERLVARSSKELVRQALVMVLEMSRHHAQLNRVSVPTIFRESVDMGDPETERRRPRESVVEERETKRVRINVLDGEESDE